MNRLWSRLCRWIPGLLVLGLGGGFAEARDPHLPRDIPSLTLYSRWDQKKTLRYLQTHPRRPYKPSWKWRSLSVRVYTDSPKSWDARQISLVQRLADWYYAPCKIRFRWSPTHTLAPTVLYRQGVLKYRFSKNPFAQRKRGETLLFLSRHVRTPLRDAKGVASLLGLSFRVLLPSGKRVLRRVPTVWVRSTLVFTTLAHELGHRLGLKHVKQRHNLMLTGNGVRSSFDLLWSSLTGYFNPVQFHFSRRQCKKMRRRWKPARKR